MESATEGLKSLKNTETAMVVLAEDKPAKHNKAMRYKNSEQWKKACEDECKILGGYCTWKRVE